MPNLFIRVDSRNKLEGTFDNFTYSTGLGRDLTITELKLVSVELPNAIYVFTTTRSNNIVRFNEGAGDLEFVIDDGSYSVEEMVSYLSSKFATTGTLTYTITYDGITNKLTISANGSFSLLFSGADTPWQEFGFDNVDTSSGTTHTGSYCVDLAGPRYTNLFLSFCPKLLLYGVYSGQFSIPIYGDSYGISYNSLMQDIGITIKPEKPFTIPDEFRVKLLDTAGNQIGLLGHWSFLLECVIAT